MSASMIKLFGSTLTKNSALAGSTSDVSTAEALKGKRVAIYFSAHWCPPCRSFTPKLAERYKELVGKGEDFEIVFVSSDKNESSFQDYFGEMPWLALPFADRDAKAQLSKKFKVSGIPALIILDEAGELINKEGRSVVMRDPSEWKPPTLWEALSGDLIAKSEIGKATVDEVRAQSDVIALYFSAHWCPPCRGFTPQLVETYKKLQAAGKPFEIIFASSDRDMKSFQEYFADMPWLAIPQGDKRKEQLSKLFGVSGIPMLVIVDAEGNIITTKGRGAVGADPEGAEFPWLPKAVNDLSGGPDGLNEETCLVAMMEGVAAEEQKKVLAILTKVAEAEKAQAKQKGSDPILFFTATSSGNVADQIRKLCGLGSAAAQPQLVMVDIPDNQGYYKAEPAALTEQSLLQFVES